MSNVIDIHGNKIAPTEERAIDAEIILAEERAVAEARCAEARAMAAWGARHMAIDAVRSAARNYTAPRDRESIRQSEEADGLWFMTLPLEDQEELLDEAVQRVLSLMSMKGFVCRNGVSVRPMDLYSGAHLGDVLRLVSKHSCLWRQIALAGVRDGLLWFEIHNGVAAVFLPPPECFKPSSPRIRDDLCACVKAMSEPYPETLPDPSWAAGTRGALR